MIEQQLRVDNPEARSLTESQIKPMKPLQKLFSNLPNYQISNPYKNKENEILPKGEKKLKRASDLRILFRFNCGFCFKNYSTITVPKYFQKSCFSCRSRCDLVVLRCTEKVLYGGYICSGCSAKFLAVFKLNNIEVFTPYCDDCSCYTKVYHILLNKSKISVRNINVYRCSNCGYLKKMAYYSVNNLIKKDQLMNLIPYCCGKVMEYNKLDRVFTHIKLDDEGNSPSYYESQKYNSAFDYLLNRTKTFNKEKEMINESITQDPYK